MKKIRVPEEINLENIDQFLMDLEGGKNKRPIISLYLPSTPDKRTHSEWNSIFSIEKIDAEESNLSKERKELVLELLDELNNYIRTIKEVDYFNTLVIFIAEDFFYTLRIPMLFELSLTLANYPLVLPLKNLDLGRDKTLVLCLDREEGVILVLEAGRFKELLYQTSDQVPKKIKGGSESWKGLKEKRVLHHIEWHLNEHLKRLEAELLNITRKRDDIKEVYLGGHREIFSKFENKLPKNFKPEITKRFVAEPDIFLKKIKKEGVISIFEHEIKKGGAK